MTRIILKHIVPAALLASAVSLFGGLGTAMADEAAEKIVIPVTSDGIWKAIDAKWAELKATIESGKLDNVHHEAFAIRDLVAALPSHSTTLSPEKLDKVKTNVKFVATLAERLDATGDAKDLAGTKQNYAKLTGVLTSIRGNYSAP